MGGFGAVPDGLRRAAAEIGDAGDRTAGMVWCGSSGEYGHPGVAGAWQSFIEEMKSFVDGLRQQAEEHSTGLRAAAESYVDVDAHGAVGFDRLGGPAGHAGHGGIASRLSSGTTPLKPVGSERPAP